MDEGTLFTRPTFARLQALLDNYDRQTGQKEVVTATEAEEQEAFLAEIFATPVLATLTRFFLAKGEGHCHGYSPGHIPPDSSLHASGPVPSCSQAKYQACPQLAPGTAHLGSSRHRMGFAPGECTTGQACKGMLAHSEQGAEGKELHTQPRP